MKFRSRPDRPEIAAAVLAALLLAVSACGSSDGNADAGVASLGDNAGISTDQPDTAAPGTVLEAPENPEDAFALFDDCMAEAGFDFGGAVTAIGGGDVSAGVLEVEPGTKIPGPDESDPQQSGGSFEDFDPEAFDEANEACRGHLANVDSGFDLTPDQQAAFEDAQLEWSECMRDRGVDVPEFDGAIGLGTIVVEGPVEGADPQSGAHSFEDFDFDFEGFEEAAEICQAVYDQFDELDGLFDESRTTG